MDPFALQEEMDAARTLRSRNTPTPVLAANNADGSNSSRTPGSHTNQRRRKPGKDGGGQESDVGNGSPRMGSSNQLHDLHGGVCAERRLRQKYTKFDDIIVGRGGFGEVFLGKRRVDRTNGIRTKKELLMNEGSSSNETSRIHSVVGDGAVPEGVDTALIIDGTEENLLSPLLPVADGDVEGLRPTSVEPVPPAVSEAEQKAAEQRRVQQRIHETVQDAVRTHSLHDLVAIKYVDKRRVTAKGLSQLHSEVETLSLLNHSNVIRLHETFEDDEALWIVMEYIRGGELGQVLKRVGLFTESVARKMCLNILLAIEYIHEKGIVHRDLKPANCLLSQETIWSLETEKDMHGSPSASMMLSSSSANSLSTSTSIAPPSTFGEQDFAGLKIADFGLAAMVGRADCLTSYCGTLHYMAPEVVGQQSGAHYGKPVDMWSCGVIAYNLLSGEQPFAGTTSDQLIDKIMVGDFSFVPPPMVGRRGADARTHKHPSDSIWVTVSPQAKDFISKLLVGDPNKRLSASEALRHPWIKAEYSDVVEIGDYPGTKGILRAHSNFWKHRQIRHRIRGAVHAVVAAHRLVFGAKLMAMRREGTSEINVLRNFGYLVHGQYEPPQRVAHASNKKFIGNMAALRRFTDMIAVSKTVEVFDVSGTNLDDVALVQHMVKVAHSHHTLIQLNLERNPIPPLAARALLRLARTPAPKLSVINVANTNLGADTIAQIDTTLKEAVRKRAETEKPNGLMMPLGIVVSTATVGGNGTFMTPNHPSSSNNNKQQQGLMSSLTSSSSLSKLAGSSGGTAPVASPSPTPGGGGAPHRVLSPFQRPTSNDSLRNASPAPSLFGGLLTASPTLKHSNAPHNINMSARDALSPTGTLVGSFASPMSRSIQSREMSPMSGARRTVGGHTGQLPPVDGGARTVARGSAAVGGGTNAVRQRRLGE